LASTSASTWYSPCRIDSRAFATPDDFKSLAAHVFAHRVVVSGRFSSTLKKSQQAEEILRDIVDSVPVPV